jgi:hypothetical protein
VFLGIDDHGPTTVGPPGVDPAGEHGLGDAPVPVRHACAQVEDELISASVVREDCHRLALDRAQLVVRQGQLRSADRYLNRQSLLCG